MFLITNQRNHSLNFTISLENKSMCVFAMYDVYMFVAINLYAPIQMSEGNTETIIFWLILLSKIGSVTVPAFAFVLFLVRLTAQ